MGILLRVGLEQSCGLVQPEGRTAWQNGAVALQTYRAGIWQAAVLIFDHGVLKPSMT
jgi:hypothetical protein